MKIFQKVAQQRGITKYNLAKELGLNPPRRIYSVEKQPGINAEMVVKLWRASGMDGNDFLLLLEGDMTTKPKRRKKTVKPNTVAVVAATIIATSAQAQSTLEECKQWRDEDAIMLYRCERQSAYCQDDDGTRCDQAVSDLAMCETTKAECSAEKATIRTLLQKQKKDASTIQWFDRTLRATRHALAAARRR